MATKQGEKFPATLAEEMKFNITLEKFSIYSSQATVLEKVVPSAKMFTPKLPLCPVGPHWQLWVITLENMTFKYPSDRILSTSNRNILKMLLCEESKPRTTAFFFLL